MAWLKPRLLPRRPHDILDFRAENLDRLPLGAVVPHPQQRQNGIGCGLGGGGVLSGY